MKLSEFSSERLEDIAQTCANIVDLMYGLPKELEIYLPDGSFEFPKTIRDIFDSMREEALEEKQNRNPLT